jgi:TRAP-type C4-dicarboxylate transport system permease small subunit
MEAQRPRQGALYTVQKIVVGGLLLAAIAVMITGVFMRYVLVAITDWLDVDTFSFFWVEETGELIQTYLAMIGGAVAISEGAHFLINLMTHKLSPRAQQRVNLFNCLIIALFGALLAWQGWLTAKLNWTLGTPALGISLGWFYAATIVGGILLIFYAFRAATVPPPDPTDLTELKAD